MSTTRDMAGALNHASGLEPIAQDGFAMDPLTSKGNEIMNNMEKEYGEKKGKSVFYASKNKGKISGVDEADEDEAEDCNAMDGGPDSGPRQRIAMELREIAERSEAARSQAEIEALQMRRNQLLIELRGVDVTNDAMTDTEIAKWEKEKANAASMEPKNVENTQPATGRFGSRPSPYVSPDRPFTRADEDNSAGTRG